MLQTLGEKILGSKLGVLLPIMFMAVTWHLLRVEPTDSYLTRTASFKDILVIGMQQGKSSACVPGSFRAVFSLGARTQTIFLYYMSVKYTLRGYFLWFSCPCYAKQMKSIQFFNPSLVRYMGAQANSCLLLIFVDWYKPSNSNVSGSKCILNWFGCIIWRPKANCDENSRKLGSIIFLFALVSSLEYIEYWLCQIWSVYMQYLRGYDHSNKCLFLVIQQAEVLLNFFGGV